MIKDKWVEHFYNNLFMSSFTLFRNPFTVTIHCSSPLTITKVIGPGGKLVHNIDEGSEAVTLVIGRFDPTIGFTVFFDMKGNTSADSLYVQAVVDMPYSNNDNRRIRILTTKLETTERLELSLHSIDEDVACTILCKSLIVEVYLIYFSH